MVDARARSERRARRRALSDADRIRLDHVHTFRLTTFEALHKVFYADRSLDAAKAWAYRMRDLDYLAVVDNALGTRAACYLTKRARQQLYGERVRRPNPYVAEADVPGVFAALWYCCLDETPRKKLSAHDFANAFPELIGAAPEDRIENRMTRDAYFLDDSYAPRRLGYLLVDTGTDPRHVRTRYYKTVRDRSRFRRWREFIEYDHRFAVTVLTTAPPRDVRRRVIEQALGRGHPSAPYRVVPVPGLLELM